MIGRKCGEAIIREYGHLFDANTTEVMDFACGTGRYHFYLLMLLSRLILQAIANNRLGI